MAEQYTPLDILALVVVMGNIALIFCGRQGSLDIAFNAVIGFYFGHKVTESSNLAAFNQQKPEQNK